MRIKKLFREPITLQSEEVVLRQVQASDMEDLFSMYSNENMFTYRPGMVRKTLAMVEKLIDTMSQEYERKERIYLAVCLSDNPDKVIGIGEIYDIDSRIERATIGYSIDEKYWGKGIATKVVGMMIDFLFREIETNRIEAHVMPENKPSDKVLLKNGMTREGLIRQGAFWNGKGIVDVYQYAILMEDWASFHNKSLEEK